MTPTSTLKLKGEKCVGRIKSISCFTVFVCTNMTETDKHLFVTDKLKPWHSKNKDTSCELHCDQESFDDFGYYLTVHKWAIQ